MSGRLQRCLRRVASLRPAPRGGGISVVMLAAYDWRYALEALPHCYGIADEVLVGVDRDRVSMAGRPFPFNARAFGRGLRGLDRAGKLRLVEEDFHRFPDPSLNETDERNRLSRLCRPGNWVVQVDADEWMLNPAEFRDWLLAQPLEREVLARWVNVFKVIGEDALVIDGPDVWVPVATCRRGAYWHHRDTGGFPLKSPLSLLHFSWGRSRAELKRKLLNFSHAREVDADALLRLWDSVTLANHRRFKDFHPLQPALWHSLRRVPLGRLVPGAR
jgi:hypothetical protein